MRFNIHHLRVLREVLRRGTVSAAAHAAYVTQPAATQAVAALERQFGAKLFDRTATGMTVTRAGRLVGGRVERALEHLREGVAEPGRSLAGREAALRRVTAAQLETLVTVVEHSRFAAAARAVQRARPTVHRAARQLEERLALALFERTSHGLQPTREAVRLAHRTQLAFAELDQARAEVRALAGSGVAGTLIGAMPLARSILVPSAVLDFAARHPAHQVSILDGPYDSLLHELRIGRAAFLVGALRNPAPYTDVVEEPLFDDPLALIVRAGHPLARERAPSVDTLRRYPWIAPRAGSPLRRQFVELFARARMPAPENPIECNSQVASRALLAASDRVMLLSALQVHQELQAGQLVALPHPHGRVVRTIGLTTRRDWRPTAAQVELLDAIRRTATRYAPASPTRAP